MYQIIYNILMISYKYRILIEHYVASSNYLTYR
jgi:hypothetical protein